MTPTPSTWPRGPSVAGLTPGERLRAEQAAAPPALFDPGEHTVREVNIYLETADEDEQTRVLELEAAGKSRAGIMDRWTTDDEEGA